MVKLILGIRIWVFYALGALRLMVPEVIAFLDCVSFFVSWLDFNCGLNLDAYPLLEAWMTLSKIDSEVGSSTKTVLPDKGSCASTAAILI